MSTLMVSVLAFVSGIKDRLESEKGATATEYSLLVAFIAFAVIGGVTALRHRPSDLVHRTGRHRRRLVQRSRRGYPIVHPSNGGVPRPSWRGRGTPPQSGCIYIAEGSSETQKFNAPPQEAAEDAAQLPSSSPSWHPSSWRWWPASSSSRTPTTCRFRSRRPPGKRPGRWPSRTTRTQQPLPQPPARPDSVPADFEYAFSPGSCTAGENMTVTITYPAATLTGIFGSTVTVTGTGAMRCEG